MAEVKGQTFVGWKVTGPILIISQFHISYVTTNPISIRPPIGQFNIIHHCAREGSLGLDN